MAATTKERIIVLEKEVESLKRQIDEGRSLSDIRADIKELRERYKAHEEYVTERLNEFEEHVTLRLDRLEEGQQEHKAAIAELKTGQLALQESVEQILAILTGKARTND